MSASFITKTVIVLLLISGVVWWFFSARGWPIKNYPSTKNGPILIFGDSLAEGQGSTVGNTLEDQLGHKMGVNVLNYGVGGNTTADGLVRLPQALEENPRVVLVLLGGNDFLRKVPRAETFQNLEKIVTAFQAQGAIVFVLGVRSGLIGGGADAEFESLAKRTGAVYVDDVLSGVFGHPELMSDEIHPNSRGYAIIAERIAPLLAQYMH
jgi:acyl-CoA thioesterase-1